MAGATRCLEWSSTPECKGLKERERRATAICYLRLHSRRDDARRGTTRNPKEIRVPCRMVALEMRSIPGTETMFQRRTLTRRKASRRSQRERESPLPTPFFILFRYFFLFTYVKAKLQGAGVHRRGRRARLRLLPIHCTEPRTQRRAAFDSSSFCRPSLPPSLRRTRYARCASCFLAGSNEAHQREFC